MSEKINIKNSIVSNKNINSVGIITNNNKNNKFKKIIKIKISENPSKQKSIVLDAKPKHIQTTFDRNIFALEDIQYNFFEDLNSFRKNQIEMMRPVQKENRYEKLFDTVKNKQDIKLGLNQTSIFVNYYQCPLRVNYNRNYHLNSLVINPNLDFQIDEIFDYNQQHFYHPINQIDLVDLNKNLKLKRRKSHSILGIDLVQLNPMSINHFKYHPPSYNVNSNLKDMKDLSKKSKVSYLRKWNLPQIHPLGKNHQKQTNFQDDYIKMETEVKVRKFDPKSLNKTVINNLLLAETMDDRAAKGRARIVKSFQVVFRTLKQLRKFQGLKYTLNDLKGIISNEKKKIQFINTRNLMCRGTELQHLLFQEFKKNNRKLILEHLKGINFNELSYIVSQSLENIKDDICLFIFNSFEWYSSYPVKVKQMFLKKFANLQRDVARKSIVFERKFEPCKKFDIGDFEREINLSGTRSKNFLPSMYSKHKNLLCLTSKKKLDKSRTSLSPEVKLSKNRRYIDEKLDKLETAKPKQINNTNSEMQQTNKSFILKNDYENIVEKRKNKQQSIEDVCIKVSNLNKSLNQNIDKIKREREHDIESKILERKNQSLVFDQPKYLRIKMKNNFSAQK